MPHRIRFQAKFAAQETRERILDRFVKSLSSEYSPSNIKAATPLDKAARYERMARGAALVDEDLAHEIHTLLVKYAESNPKMLTPHAEEVIKRLEEIKQVYITELDVTRIPQADLTNIDLVSFAKKEAGMRRTLEVLAEIIIHPLGLQAFTKPKQKGGINSGYFSSHSITTKDLEGVTVSTDLKVRKGVHY